MHVHRSLARAGAVAFLAMAGGVVSSACVADESSLFIRECMVIPRDMCLVQPSTTGAFLSSGVVDAAFRSEYTCAALLENQLVARGDVNKLRTETSHIEFYQAEVQVMTDDPKSKSTVLSRPDNSPAQFTVPISGFADPGNGGQPGLGLTFITMIDSATLQGLRAKALTSGNSQRVVSSVIVKGRTTGGLEVHSNEFRFPITVFAGSLCTDPPGEQCAQGSSKPTADCLPGQDSNVDCRLLDPCTQLECPTVIDPMTMMPYNSLAKSHCPSTPGVVDKSCCKAK